MRAQAKFLVALGALALCACRTHEVDDCYAECTDRNLRSFSACVASGAGDCLAGNRRCCALAEGCVGPLDDQTVVTTRTDCELVEEETCWPACDAEDEAMYEGCVDLGGMGGCESAPDLELCCADMLDCLGELGRDGEVIVTSEACCVVDDDCPGDQVCDVETGQCRGSGVCGDSNVDVGEACDPGPVPDLACPYGEVACLVCDATCQHTTGTTSFCGDGAIDRLNGEECDPPGATCDDACRTMLPLECSNGRMDGDETDTDCGGTVCDPCAPGGVCRMDRDCGITTPECSSTAFCEPTKSLCVEVEGCTDGDACTDDVCQAGVGCTFPATDVDMDGDGPLAGGCGGDCDDFDPTSSSLETVDLGCFTAEMGFGVDNDCDMRFDEDC